MFVLQGLEKKMENVNLKGQWHEIFTFKTKLMSRQMVVDL